ncbi:hypothetical protein LY78DRAFT_715845 [Colletotrichum sublineola]|nr:hypothetical protein LY78DRAFT_715845 [Colletotrichum sublineola]
MKQITIFLLLALLAGYCSGSRRRNPPSPPEVCISGRDRVPKLDNLCQFTCEYGFCLETLCECTAKGKQKDPPALTPGLITIRGDKVLNPLEKVETTDLKKLCQFSFKYGHCPEDVCKGLIDGFRFPDRPGLVNRDHPVDHEEQAQQNRCFVYKDPQHWNARAQTGRCETICDNKPETEDSIGICVGSWPIDKPIPWQTSVGQTFAYGTCKCGQEALSVLMDHVIDSAVDSAVVTVQTNKQLSVFQF